MRSFCRVSFGRLRGGCDYNVDTVMRKIIIIVLGSLAITFLYNALGIKIEAPNTLSTIVFFVCLGLYGAAVTK